MRTKVRLCLTIAMTIGLLDSACDNPTRPGEGSVRTRWFVSFPAGFPHPRPVATDLSAYFATGGGFVVSLDQATGTTTWRTEVGSNPNSASPELGGENLLLRNQVLIAPVQFHTSAIDVSTGREIWRYEAPLDTMDKQSPRPGYVQRSRIAADDNTVFIPAWGASVSAVDIRSGQPRWVWRVDPTVAHRSGAFGVVLSGDTVFATVWHFVNALGTQAEAWLIALDKNTGQQLWKFVVPRQTAGTMINDAPAVWNNLVFLTINSGDVYAIDRNNQTIVWHQGTQLPASGVGSALISGPAVYDNILYVSGSDEKVHAYQPATGDLIWEGDSGQVDNDLLVTDKFVYASTVSTLVILRRDNGQRYAGLGHPRGTVDYTFTSPPAEHNGRIFISFADGAWSFDEP